MDHKLKARKNNHKSFKQRKEIINKYCTIFLEINKNYQNKLLSFTFRRFFINFIKGKYQISEALFRKMLTEEYIPHHEQIKRLKENIKTMQEKTRDNPLDQNTKTQAKELIIEKIK